MRHAPAIVALLACSAALPPALFADDLRVHTDTVTNTIDPFIYGHFFEHIYNGGDNGLWGEMVWNRSFEYVADAGGKWDIKDGVLAQTAIVDGARLLFGDPTWTDYEFTVEGRKISGNEGFLLLVRAVNDTQLFWANIAGWTNTQHRLQHLGAPRAADLGQVVRGRVNNNQWYKLRVRCEGSRIQAWLDDAQVVDATLPPDLMHGGAVGLGAWQTAVEYRNPKVTALDGKVLFEGMPELPKPKSSAGIHWKPFGTTTAHLTTTGAFNDETAVVLDSIAVPGTPADKDAWGGISQNNFNLKKGESYKGSLYLKGNGSPPGPGAVRFLSGPAGKIVAEVPLKSPTNQWQECPIEFTAAEDAPDAVMQIAFPAGTNVTLDQVSLMSDSSIKNDGFRPDIYKAFADLQPTIIRWPGGCYLEQYHWKNGIGPQSARKKNLTAMWNDYDPNALGTDEYITLSRKLKSEPLLVINTGMHVTGTKNAAEWAPWIQEACDWVEYCNGPVTSKWGAERAKNGHPEPYRVKYWEIDNELWRSLQPNPAVYAQSVPLFAAAMKKIDPTITIIAHGGNGNDRRYNRTLVTDAAPAFDILSIHHYMDAPRFASGVAEQDALYKDTIALIAASGNPKIKLDISEWNAQTTDWRTGLYAAGLLNTFEKYGEHLTIGGPALLFRHTSANDWDNAFINFDHKGFFVAPNYVMMKLWRENFAPERLAVDGTPPITANALNLIATRTTDAGKVILKAVNPTNAAITVNATLDGPFTPAAAKFQLVAPGALNVKNSMTKPDMVKPTAGEVALKDKVATFILPPYSAGVVTLTR